MVRGEVGALRQSIWKVDRACVECAGGILAINQSASRIPFGNVKELVFDVSPLFLRQMGAHRGQSSSCDKPIKKGGGCLGSTRPVACVESKRGVEILLSAQRDPPPPREERSRDFLYILLLVGFGGGVQRGRAGASFMQRGLSGAMEERNGRRRMGGWFRSDGASAFWGAASTRRNRSHRRDVDEAPDARLLDG